MFIDKLMKFFTRNRKNPNGGSAYGTPILQKIKDSLEMWHAMF